MSNLTFPSLPEAQRQVLIALIELAEPAETPNNTHYSFYPQSLDEAKKYFLTMLEDWQNAYLELLEHGLVQKNMSGYSLTPVGSAIARQERLDHPPIWYWYREYYTLTAFSGAYHRFCEQLYGRDLCQTNFSDMAQIDFLISRIPNNPGLQVLELGCGKGLFAEYLSQHMQAHVLGIDYVTEAIQQAAERTSHLREKLEFRVANFDHLEDLLGSFDVVISIDTLYMPNDLQETLRRIHRLVAPAGQMLIFYSEMLFDINQPREILTAEGSTLAKALRQLSYNYQTWDFNEATFQLMRRKRSLVEKMRSEFETEGTIFLYNHLHMESDGESSPYDPATSTISRYLYQVTV